MGEVLNVFQYQPVLFTSTTTGAVPISLSWSFPGGAPLSGTGVSETVIYNAPGNYTVTLTATDVFGTTDFLMETNIIRVNPVTITPGISGPIPSTVKMNTGYNLFDSSSGNPYPAISWYWQLPYGVTASTQNVGVTGYVDWYTLTGTYLGDPGSSYTGNISLTVNNGYSPATATSTVEVQKLGPTEELGINATGGVGPFSTQTGASGGILQFPPVTGSPLATLADFGYSGTGSTAYAFHIDLRLRTGSPSSTRYNQFFHSTNESAIVNINTGFYSNNLSSPTPDLLGGFLMVEPTLYSTYDPSFPLTDGISQGKYLIQNQAYDFYLADINTTTGSPGLLSEVYNNRNYSVNLINYLITNPYKLSFSGNIQNVNSGGGSTTFIDLTNGGGSGDNNPVVYSSQYLVSQIANFPQIYEVYITFTPTAGPPTGATATFGSLGSTGNDPLTNGMFYVAQNNSNGAGFVSILNAAINSSSIPGGTGTIIFESQEFFNCDYSGTTGPGYNPSNYHGVALKVINKTIVSSVSVTDNSSILTSGTITVAPFTCQISSNETCSGMFDLTGPGIQIFSTQNNFLSVGGSIAYT